MILKPVSELIKDSFDKDSLIYINDDELQYNSGVSNDVIKDIKEKTFQIYSGFYEFNKGCDSPMIYLNGRGSNSGKVQLKIQNFKPYCYIKKKGGKYKSYLGDECEKLVFKGMHPSRVKTFRELRRKKGFPMPYEADILFVRRFLIDMYDYFKPKSPIQPKIAILDVETNHPINDDIIAYSINNPSGDLYYESLNETEFPFELGLNILEQLEDFDIVTGWNVKFDVEAVEDLTIMVNRYLNYPRTGKYFSKEDYIEEIVKIEDTFNKEISKKVIDTLLDKGYLKEERGVIVLGDKKFDPIINHHTAPIDMLTVSKKMHAREIRGKWNLGNVGIQMAGIDKMHIGAKHIKDLSPEELLEYNVRDVIIPEIIDNMLGGIEAHLILSWSLHCLLEETLITAVVNDIALLRAYHRENVILPSRDFSDKGKEVKYDAAEPDARPDIYKGLLVTDLVHAYPFAVISKNVSPETKDDEGIHILKYINKAGENKEIRFNDKKSVFIETLKEIMNDRKKIKEKLKTLKKNSASWKRYKKIDFALKTQAAAFSHGIFGWANSRMRDYEVADAITAIVRDLINTIKEACDIINQPWVYVHTDSCFVNVNKKYQDSMLGYLNDIIKDYSAGSKILPELDVKGYYPNAYIHSPARNVLVPEDGDINEVDTWDVTGMNFMRSETPEELADIEIELIKLKMKGASIPVLKYKLKRRVIDLLKLDSTKLGLIKPLNKEINEYGRTLKDGTIGGFPYHIKALVKAMHEYGFSVNRGEKYMILPIVTDETVGIRKIRRKRIEIAFDIDKGLPSEYQIDYEYYLRGNLWGKIYELFDMKPKDLEKEIMDEKMMKMLNKGGKICQTKDLPKK